jgi:hypothetical protein
MSFSYLIGKTIEEAGKELSSSGIPWRVSAQDNRPMLLTCDYNSSRVNLQVQNGIVKNVELG